MTLLLRGFRGGYVGSALLAIVGSVAFSCGGDAPPIPLTAQPATSVPSPTIIAPAINPSVLPVELHVPGEPAVPGMPVDASESDFGDYLHVVDLSDGTVQLVGGARLGSAPDGYHRPLLSPDRSRVAYPSRGSVVVVDIASGEARTFPIPGYVWPAIPCSLLEIRLSWSPDSTRIAVNTNVALFVLDATSGLFQKVVDDVGTCEVTWSPNGEWIAFATQNTLARIHPDGSGRFDGPEFYAPPDFAYTGPHDLVWSTDSTHVFFSANKLINHWNETISFSADMDFRATPMPIGDTITWLSPPMPPNPSRDLPFIEAISTDGTRTAYFRSDHDANWNWTSFVETRDLDGKNARTLVTRPDSGASIAYTLFWSPDDAWIAYPYRGPNSGPGSARIVGPESAEDLSVVVGPDPIRLVKSNWVVCDVLVVGWLSTTSLITWTTCTGSL